MWVDAVGETRNVESTQHDASPGGTPVETALQRRCADTDSASYERTVRTVVNDFVDRSGVSTVEEIDVETIRDYARTLREDENFANSTVKKYFATTRAWLGWCVREQIIDTNPADTSDAEEPLPETEGDSNPQFWDPDDRERLCYGLDERLDHALDGEINADPKIAQRDQVLIWMLGYTGVRGAEVLNDRDEDHPLRQGLRWKHLRLDEGTMKVLGKTRDAEYPILPTVVVDRLRRWKRRLKPPSKEWPVFPTISKGALHRRDLGILPELESYGYRKDDDVHPFDACHEHEVIPPAMTVEAGRNRLRYYSDLWDLPTDADDENTYMEPHGGRRRLGDDLYEIEPKRAQDQLRHNSIETTNKAYRERNPQKRQKELDDALGFD